MERENRVDRSERFIQITRIYAAIPIVNQVKQYQQTKRNCRCDSLDLTFQLNFYSRRHITPPAYQHPSVV